ncbi:glycosyltransferase family 25 protein [Ruegeria sediminis]|uniref:Glycosyltransferase family 25 protein n=1 Tax=Ruegeria sediminis TaxID=2583820 RepID=A0ABY2X0B0_9RHOB|nr:glycosyltransferase family 25 protein [Ruegeria sediminis]TMV08676.1 glycosyltransferase family 25 protein [Ruegeria sediminis]
MQNDKPEPRSDIFYINLDRVPARRDFVERHFVERGLGLPTRLSATDAAAPGALDHAGYVPGTGGRWGLKLSEIACFESHRRIWQIAVERGLNAVAIFEDDLRLSCDAAPVIERLLENGDDFDLVKIDYCPKINRFGPFVDMNGVPVRELLTMASSAAGYILSGRGAEKLLAKSERYSDHLDDFLFTPGPGWRMFQSFPAVGVQAVWHKDPGDAPEVLKTSERTQAPEINCGLDKGPLWFRLRRELLAARRKLHWRFGGEARLLEQGGFVGHIPCAEDLDV